MILIVSSFSTKTTDFEDEDPMIVSPDRPSKTFLEKVFHKKLGFIANVPKKLPTWVSFKSWSVFVFVVIDIKVNLFLFHFLFDLF